MLKFPLPVLGFAAFSGSGKTTLLKKLLPVLVERGLRVAVVKHAHHAFEVDHPGKDSYELRKAGAAPMLIASANRMAMMLDFPQEPSFPKEPDLAEMIDFLPQHRLDAVLVEGFKAEHFPKIEVYRPATGKPLMAQSDANIIAIATDEPTVVTSKMADVAEAMADTNIADANSQIPQDSALKILDLNHCETVADFVIEQIRLQTQKLKK
jgi:molybdopterin-guanine dinucleotide biosynthesis protein B